MHSRSIPPCLSHKKLSSETLQSCTADTPLGPWNKQQCLRSSCTWRLAELLWLRLLRRRMIFTLQILHWRICIVEKSPSLFHSFKNCNPPCNGNSSADCRCRWTLNHLLLSPRAKCYSTKMLSFEVSLNSAKKNFVKLYKLGQFDQISGVYQCLIIWGWHGMASDNDR